ncbi:MAG: DUF664 domain-containing protein [Mycobacterium sp.]|nr:DUF664 domain-containing protein [Mycobacterium sp.]
MSAAQPIRRREQGPVGERATLESFLNDYRDIAVRKVAGLSDADARRRLVASPTTVGGLIKHLRWAEYGWFDQLLQETRRQPSHARARMGVPIPPRRVTRHADRGLPSTVRAVPTYRRALSARSPSATPSDWGGVAALDLRAHDRRNRAPHRTTGYLARTTRWRNRIRRLSRFRQAAAPTPFRLCRRLPRAAPV